MIKGTVVNRMSNIHRAVHVKTAIDCNENPVETQNIITLTKMLPLETYYVYLLG
jgi:hypothetical protein